MPVIPFSGSGILVKNYEDAYYRDLLHLPFPDQTDNILKHLFFKNNGPRTFKTDDENLQHIKHEHQCALLLPEKIRHKCDKHPMSLSYFPIENHKSEYFREICEEELNPHCAFYHCHECVWSVHSACASLILQSETDTYSCFGYYNSIYLYVNVKFGKIHKTPGHQHPLSFTQGIASDGRCSMCGYPLRYLMIFKCPEFKYAIDYECCKDLNSS
ncbi:protein kinase C-like, phorbol ester/diacylglycerol-binding domain, DC1, C1-like protein [Artemisia annua]|uniref:Protein kinase C-like, phorbol ester/diacylglycerol-binding domain, DC1, C1-like protein n=1 Tax=Artemisia annua TaxID=35608 RepID=A0A2U1L1H3_ARTAN|nr:protein kinase C-like, phorbol ester/diacylglycerol-binding domain, DC1, C1-like protein [Artemisia annua]